MRDCPFSFNSALEPGSPRHDPDADFYFPPDDFKLTPKNFKFDCISSDEGPPDALLTAPAARDRYAADP